MQGPIWTDAVTAWATAIGTLFTGLGFVFVVKQLAAVRRQLTLATIEQLYGRMHSIHELFVQKPGLRAYFYDDKPANPGASDYAEVCAATEMIADFFQQVSLQLDLMPKATRSAEGWRAYMDEIVSHSPALRRHFREHHAWYPSRLVAVASDEPPNTVT
jgi:hypothetical protein